MWRDVIVVAGAAVIALVLAAATLRRRTPLRLVRRSGRRPGNQDTRQSILDAARAVFADKGFDKASIRAIATEAKVDPALVHHYFGTKDKLFLASMNTPIESGRAGAEGAGRAARGGRRAAGPAGAQRLGLAGRARPRWR